MMCHDLDSLRFLMNEYIFKNEFKNQGLNDNNQIKIKQGVIKSISSFGNVNIDLKFAEFNDIDTALVVVEFVNGTIGNKHTNTHMHNAF